VDIDLRAAELMKAVCQGDASAREAAVEEFSSIVARYPDNTDFRLQYAFALMAASRKEEALKQARLLAHAPSTSHSFYFNLGQVFWLCGDSEQGRHHLDLALRFARNEEEKQDVRDRLADLDP